MGSQFFFIQINPNFSRQYLESHKHLFPYASKVTEPFLKIFSFPAVITNDKEFEAYSFGSFVADCGGLLGLFIGFNFLMILDFIVMIFKKIKSSL